MKIVPSSALAFLVLALVPSRGGLPGRPEDTPISSEQPVRKAQALFDVREFGAKGDGQTDDQAAIQAAAAALVSNGGGTLFFPPGTYLIWKLGSTLTHPTLRAFAGIRGITILGDHATVLVDSARRKTGFHGWLFTFTNCNDVKLDGMAFKGPHFSDVTPDGGLTFNGAGVALFDGNDTNIVVPRMNVTDMAYALLFDKVEGSSTGISNITLDTLVARYVGYALRCGRTGNNLTAALIDAFGSYRTYYIDGVEHHKVHIVSAESHHAADVNISAYTYQKSIQPHVTRDITLTYTNTETYQNASAQSFCIGIFWQGWRQDSPDHYSAGTIEDVSIDLHVRYHGKGSPSFPIWFDRMNATTGYDSTDRHRKLINFSVTGQVEGDMDTRWSNAGGNPPAWLMVRGKWGDTTNPAFHPWNADSIIGFRIHDMTITGNMWAYMRVGSFVTSPVIENVRSDKYLLINNTAEGTAKARVPVIYRQCDALSFGGLDPSWDTYLVLDHCQVRLPASQPMRNGSVRRD